MIHGSALEESMENMEFSFNTLGGLIIKGCVYIYFDDVLPSVKLNIQDMFRNHS